MREAATGNALSPTVDSHIDSTISADVYNLIRLQLVVAEWLVTLPQQQQQCGWHTKRNWDKDYS